MIILGLILLILGIVFGIPILTRNRAWPSLIHLADARNDLRVHFDLNPHDIDLDPHAGVLQHPPGEPPEPVPPWPPLEPVPAPSPPPVPGPPEPFPPPPSPDRPTPEPRPTPIPPLSVRPD